MANADDEDDPILQALERAAPYFDADYDPRIDGVRPSTMMTIRYCVLTTDPNPAAREHGRQLALSWLEEGRRRWRAGFYANPHRPEPLKRRRT